MEKGDPPRGSNTKGKGEGGPLEREPERRLAIRMKIRIRIEINNGTRHATTYLKARWRTI